MKLEILVNYSFTSSFSVLKQAVRGQIQHRNTNVFLSKKMIIIIKNRDSGIMLLSSVTKYHNRSVGSYSFIILGKLLPAVCFLENFYQISQILLLNKHLLFLCAFSAFLQDRLQLLPIVHFGQAALPYPRRTNLYKML